MEDSLLQLQDASGKRIDLLNLTCSRCGYTMPFDLDIALSRPPNNNVNEIFPECVNRLRETRLSES